MSLTNEQFDKMEKEFLVILKQIHDEIGNAISVLRQSSPGGQHIKSELCLAFVGADTFSRIYRIFKGATEEELDENIEGRFKTWLSEFVLTNKNEVYRKHKEDINCDVELAWRLRNSLIHFFALPNGDGLPYVVGFSGRTGESRKDIENKFLIYGNIKAKLLHPQYLIEAILLGFLVQLLSMKEMIQNRPQDYIRCVLTAHKILMREGTVHVADPGVNNN